MWQELLQQLQTGNAKAIARSISLVENEAGEYEQLLRALPASAASIIGITGPPGAGKSTLTDALIRELVQHKKKIAVLCVDPSSPFKSGALLGDRIRMSDWYNHPDVFIRSLASRGTLGGLHPKIIEITDVLKACPFDYIIVETVGVGQSEVEIAGLADITLVVLVPESGDDIQAMKAGLMEIAGIFVVNKADRPQADAFAQHLTAMLSQGYSHHVQNVPVIKTIATQHTGVAELMAAIDQSLEALQEHPHRCLLLAEKAWQLIIQKKMRHLDKQQLIAEIREQSTNKNFNLYQFIDGYCDGSCDTNRGV